MNELSCTFVVVLYGYVMVLGAFFFFLFIYLFIYLFI